MHNFCQSWKWADIHSDTIVLLLPHMMLHVR